MQSREGREVAQPHPPFLLCSGCSFYRIGTRMVSPESCIQQLSDGTLLVPIRPLVAPGCICHPAHYVPASPPLPSLPTGLLHRIYPPRLVLVHTMYICTVLQGTLQGNTSHFYTHICTVLWPFRPPACSQWCINAGLKRLKCVL